MGTRRAWMIGLAGLLLLRAGPAFGQETGPALERPNVLFIVVDDLNTDIGCYGHPLVKTPNIDRLAAAGRRFGRAYCQYTLCNPSRTSVLSGLRPDTTQVYSNGKNPREALPHAVFLPELFRNHGYHTARAGKIFHQPADDPDAFDDPRSWSEVLESNNFEGVRGPDTTGAMPWDGPESELPDGAASRAAARFLGRPRAEPFFLAVGFHKPHTPLVSPRKYWDAYRIEDIRLPRVPEGGMQDTPRQALRASFERPDDPRRSILAYDACVSFMDAQVGIVLDALERRPALARNTIIVLWSDHGYHLDDHRGLWGKLTLFRRSTRVPFIMVVPGMAKPGAAGGGIVELLDIYPTLADLCGLPVRDRLQGKSLRPILMRDPDADVKEAAYTVVDRGSARAVMTGHWRYTRWGPSGVDELYDLSGDPMEFYNLADRPGSASVVEKLRHLLKLGRP